MAWSKQEKVWKEWEKPKLEEGDTNHEDKEQKGQNTTTKIYITRGNAEMNKKKEPKKENKCK